MNEILKPGTPCFLQSLVQRPALIGHTVQVVSGPVAVPDDEPGTDWFTVTAPWARALFHGRDMMVPRRCLLPIVPPDPAPRGSRKRTPVLVEQ
jgi:hypothetical protein